LASLAGVSWARLGVGIVVGNRFVAALRHAFLNTDGDHRIGAVGLCACGVQRRRRLQIGEIPVRRGVCRITGPAGVGSAVAAVAPHGARHARW
jgi:hypothetical protein